MMQPYRAAAWIAGWLVVLAAVGRLSAQERAAAPPGDDTTYDVVVYGGTAGGVAAAVQVRRLGKTVLLIEPSQHVGGLTSGGLGATDIGNKAAIGGISREFYRRVRSHYERPSAWRQERPADYRSGRASEQGREDTMWTFEPSVAERILRDMLREADAPVICGERLELTQRVPLRDGAIVELRMESGRRFRGRRYIDATYEGDLMARAGVSYHVGREANAVYQETLNGVQVAQATKHQLQPGVDPYVIPGDPSSGLLPGVTAGPPGEPGSGDRRVQAYNFRMCITDVPANQLPFEKPEGYDEQRYELLFRNFAAGEKRIPWSLFLMPNRKTDVNNNFGFSTDNIGKSYEWADGDYATRDRIYRDHLLYQRGLMWTLANHPRVPESIRQEVSRWGNCRDEFPEAGGWSHQIYVREARRMISDYVMTQHNCQGQKTAEDSVGLAAYTMDSHHVQRYVDDQGHARNEGDVQVGGFPPYPISYRSLVPRAAECTNLLVPVCLSASHIAYGSIRMEPVFMVLGQSAATAACLSLDQQVPVQQVNYQELARQLQADGQVLAWTQRAPGIDPKSLPGIVLDDAQGQPVGDWPVSSSIPGFIGRGYAHDANTDKGRKKFVFQVQVPEAGRYEVRLAYTANPNRATNVPVTVQHREGTHTARINQRQAPPLAPGWVSLGRFPLAAGSQPVVSVSTEDTDGHVVVDAIQLLRE